MPGPRAKSVQLRLVEGTKSDHSDLNRPIAPRSAFPKPPTWFPIPARKVYQETVRRLSELNLATEVDTEYLISYVMTVMVMRECELAIASMGLKGSEHADAWEKAHRRFCQMSKELGLTPAARSGMRIKPEEPARTDLFAS